MATVCKSSVCRPSFSFAALAASALLVLAALPTGAAAQEANEPSDYAPVMGEPFFVLTDTQYGTTEEALLRVEVSRSGTDALRQYGGVDVALYRVPDPLAFLKAQKNLHRVDVTARPRDEGVSNTLAYLWSNAWNKSRRAWRDLFTENAKLSVTKTAPALKTQFDRPDYRPVANFKPLPGFELVDNFRYPLMAAKPIDPLGKRGVSLAGSSSNFMPSNEGNFHVPLGRLRPGLYIAEAILGNYRAATFVFVSDTVAVTKLASGTLTVWTAHRADGRPVLGAALHWTDGRGVLASATTDANGLATLSHASPERTYLLGQDTAGGVFISENFYYDSEIYDTKLYSVTDRPLYRPGDEVNLKFMARAYRAANESSPAQAGKLDIDIIDPNGTPAWSGIVQLSAERGAHTAFRLPEDAPAGGYEIRTRYQGKTYGAAFRVAEYVKPHLEITLTPDRESFKTGEPVSGTIRLSYPNGDPVKNAAIELTLRAQTLTMVQGELRYSGLFPVELSTDSLKSDERGEAKFSLPPAKEPSRLILSLLASDGAAYRVRKTQELLVERAAVSWKLTGERKFSMPGKPPRFSLEPENPGAGGEALSPPTQWEIVRLEDQSRSSGPFDPAAREWSPTLDAPGSYSLMLRDDKGRLIAATAHWVGSQGGDAPGIATLPGTLEMVTDKEVYQPGDTAEVLLSFSEPVEEALLTLERDRVEEAALLSAARGGDVRWVSAERLAPNQWRVRLPVAEAYAPNMTFSAVYVKGGEYVFQNAGLVVEKPRLALDIKPDKASVQPGETVTVDIDVSLKGKPVQAVLTVSVVDEMIYALQAEIAPDIVEFFQHVRRNNVRTGASLNFITYDEAVNYASDAARQPPARHQYNERGIKVLERARRDDTDTAAWQPALVTDAEGRARFSFKMPDALSRWRIVVRAVALDGKDKARAAQRGDGSDVAGGLYGQRAAWVQSDKPLYAKWTSPDWMREGDAPVASLAVFNNTQETRTAEIVLKLAGQEIVQKATLPRGISYLPFNLPPFTGAQTARLEVRENGTLVDALETPLEAEPVRWRGLREQTLELERGAAALALPNDARRLRLRLAANGSEHFLRIADSLIDYPWGCVEQTSSRLIPLAIVTPLLAPDRTLGKTAHLWQTLSSQRLRLAALAGPQAVFGWWGRGTGDNALMTAYAYYADWHAARALGIDLPARHWERVLEVYRDQAKNEPVLHRALSLWFIQQMGLPVRTQAEGLLSDLSRSKPDANETNDDGDKDSPLLNAPDSPLGLAYARVLAASLAASTGIKSGLDGAALEQARSLLQASPQPSAHALLLLDGSDKKAAKTAAAAKAAATAKAAAILAEASEETPTLDRALTLVWTRRALGGDFAARASSAKPSGKWQPLAETRLGQAEWHWPGKALPKSLQLSKPEALTAILRFESEETEKSALPVEIERKLYRLEQRGLEKGVASFDLVPVDPAAGLSAQELYLDEIRLSSKHAHRFGIVEAPLPPGAAIERSTWGISLIDAGGGEARPIDRAIAEEQRERYGVPVELLPADGEIVLHHLLRVGQTGRFTLPPVRYYRMYQPEKKAYAEEGSTAWVVK